MIEGKRILIAGIGNIFFGDDAFGCEVAQQLALRTWPDGVHVRDFGIRGIDLAYSLMEPYEHFILIDAVGRGGAPGTLYFIEPDIEAREGQASASANLWDAHTMDPEKVLVLAKSLGADAKNVIIVGCEPTPFDPEGDIQSGLSEPVQSAAEQAVQLIQLMVEEAIQTPDWNPRQFHSFPQVSNLAATAESKFQEN